MNNTVLLYSIYILLIIIVFCILIYNKYYNVPVLFDTFNNNNIKYIYKGYRDLLKDYESVKYTTGGIPKIIIKTSWQTRKEFPRELNTVLNNTIIMNPGYNLYYFDNDEVEEFMKSYSMRAYNAYNKLVPGAFKADLFRYCILEKYGGCYSDIGHITYDSFDNICENNKLVLVKDLYDTGIHNALICCIPHHPYIITLVEECIKNIEYDFYGYCSLSITGPVLAGTVFYKLLMNYAYGINNDYKNESADINKIMFDKYIIPGTSNDTKILKLTEIGDIQTTNNDNKYIIDINNNILIRTKFENYYELMYSNKPYYNHYWTNKKVYS